jgi:hypothetical protein
MEAAVTRTAINLTLHTGTITLGSTCTLQGTRLPFGENQQWSNITNWIHNGPTNFTSFAGNENCTTERVDSVYRVKVSPP